MTLRSVLELHQSRNLLPSYFCFNLDTKLINIFQIKIKQNNISLRDKTHLQGLSIICTLSWGSSPGRGRAGGRPSPPPGGRSRAASWSPCAGRSSSSRPQQIFSFFFFFFESNQSNKCYKEQRSFWFMYLYLSPPPSTSHSDTATVKKIIEDTRTVRGRGLV